MSHKNRQLEATGGDILCNTQSNPMQYSIYTFHRETIPSYITGSLIFIYLFIYLEIQLTVHNE